MKEFTLTLVAVLLMMVGWEFLSYGYSSSSNKSSPRALLENSHEKRTQAKKPPSQQPIEEQLSGLHLDKEQLKRSWPHLTAEEREALLTLKHGKAIALPDNAEASSPAIESTSHQLLDDADYHVLKTNLADQLANDINSDTGFQPTPDDQRTANQILEDGQL